MVYNTPNEARAFTNKPGKAGGDELVCNGSYIKVSQIGNSEGGNGDAGNSTFTEEGQPWQE